MPTYAVHYTYTDDTEKRMGVRTDHRDYLAARPEILVGGAYAPEEDPAGLLIFRADSREDLEALLADDPYRKAGGIVAEAKIVEWRPAIGPVADQLK